MIQSDSISYHVRIARDLWKIYLRKKGTDAGEWARFSARVHMKRARVCGDSP